MATQTNSAALRNRDRTISFDDLCVMVIVRQPDGRVRSVANGRWLKHVPLDYQ